MRSYPFVRLNHEEIPVAPHSAFWLIHQQIDIDSDPLVLLMLAEEGNEEALETLACLHQKPKYESMYPRAVTANSLDSLAPLMVSKRSSSSRLKLPRRV